LNIVVLLIMLVAAAGAATSMAIARGNARREAQSVQDRARDDAERALVQDRPDDYIYWQGLRHQVSIAHVQHLLQIAQRELKTRQAALTAAIGADWSGAALALRLLATPVVAVLFVLSAILNVEIFVALNGGPDAAAVAKGIGASMLELIFAVIASHLLRNRDSRSPAWQGRTWSTLAALAITLVFIYQYAPARSARAIGPTVAQDQLVVAHARAELVNGQPDQQAITAADAKLHDDTARLQEAQASDQAQSILFPIGEVLGGELALEGGLALITIQRRRRLHRNVKDTQQEVDDHTLAINVERQRAVSEVVEQLAAAGHHGVSRLVDGANARRTSAPQTLPSSAHSPTAPSRTQPPNPTDVPPPEPDGVSHQPINLNELHHDPPGDPGKWDLGA
jgi:hypothetical protein